MEKLTISVAMQAELDRGFTQRTAKTQGQELTSQSKIIFRKDMNRSRDMEIREQTLKEIMDNRKVSRKVAEMILADPM